MKTAAIILFSFLLFSCNNSKKTAVATNEVNNTESPNRGENKAVPAGTDFSAKGDIPVHWLLTMNYDDTVRFTADDGLSVKFAFSRLKKEVTAEKTSFTGKINGSNIIVTQDAKTCTLPTERKVYSQQVSFTYNGKVYNGCGEYFVDYNLAGKWLLEKINSTPVTEQEYNRIPVLQFDLDKKRVSGNDGCNTIGGSIEVQGKRIRFSAMMSTRMACAKKSIDHIISTQISDQLVSYYFAEGKLYLYLSDDSKLVFKKG